MSRALIAAACLAAWSAQAAPITNTYSFSGPPQVLDGQAANLSVAIPDFGTIQSFIVHLTFAKCGSPATGALALSLVSGQYQCTDSTLASLPNEIDVGLSGPSFPLTKLIFSGDGISYSTYSMTDQNGDAVGGGRVVLQLRNDASALISGADLVPGGPFIAEGALPDVADSLDVNGTWFLNVEDIAQGAPLGLESASLEITFDQITGTVPVPGTLALFGLGLAGLGALKRRR